MALRRKIDEKFLDVDASMQGTLTFKDPVNLKINGKFEGTLDARGVLTIGPNAMVTADIIGDTIIIEGKVRGKITARESLEILSTAVVDGDIYPNRLIISDGGIFNGRCQMLAEILSAEELARYLEVEINTIIDWANQGKIPAIKQANEWRFERKAIDAWIASGKISK
ncbi:MAG: polymer-forming cytoskeletal protein [Candidatus Omnitrophica bacterium]|nr:polymer-forming cytoskeletal protein [Candidatus Omnitrophota bacterium]